MRRLWLALGSVLLALLVATSAVSAGDEWCYDDPPVAITTPGGHLVVVYVTNGAQGLEHLASVQTATITYTVTASEGGTATVVRMSVRIADDAFGSHYPVSSTVSSGPLATGTIYAQQTGFSGQAIELQFKLDVP